MKCSRCKSTEKTKDGKIKGVQRYKCKSCGYLYTVELKSTAKPMGMKRQALHLYLEGLGFRAIGRFLKVSHVSVYKWIKSFGEDLEDIKNNNKIELVEMDEMHLYWSKKTTAGFGLLLIDMGRNLSTAYLAIEEQKQAKSYGKKQKKSK